MLENFYVLTCFCPYFQWKINKKSSAIGENKRRKFLKSFEFYMRMFKGFGEESMCIYIYEGFFFFFFLIIWDVQSWGWKILHWVAGKLRFRDLTINCHCNINYVDDGILKSFVSLLLIFCGKKKIIIKVFLQRKKYSINGFV